MKRFGMALLTVAFAVCAAQAQQAPAASAKKSSSLPDAPKPAATQQTQHSTAPSGSSGALATDKQKTSYAIGMEMGKGLKSQDLDVDPDLVNEGLRDALSGAKPLMSDEELKQVITTLQAEIRQKQMKAAEEAAAENKKKGDDYMASNAKKDGVVSLPDGLQYKILTPGNGKKPTENDTVLCNYKGSFIDGTEFDSSAKQGKPVPFEVKNVIPGFKEVLQLMPVGSKWQVVIPPTLAYGERGAGGVIAPNSTLVFEIELVSIQEPGSSPADAPQARTN